MENNPSPRPKATRGFALFYGIGVGLLLVLGVIVFKPVEWSEAKLRFRLWRAGASTVLWEKHRGFTQDRCQGKPPAECGCVWFIHGMGDSVTTWRKVFLTPDAFGDRPVRLFAIDLPGHGGSPRRKDSTDYRASRMAHELDEAVGKTELCAKNAVVGNSFGGWVATHMTLKSPARYRHLILIGPGGTVAAEHATAGLFETPTVESLREFQKRAYFKPRELSDREWSIAVTRMKGGSVDEIRKAQVPEDRLDSVLPKVRVTTTVIHGSADQIIPEAAIRPFTVSIPGAKRVELPECGHLPQKECPEKLFAAIREAFNQK